MSRNSITCARRSEAHFVPFDVLHLDGRDVRNRPILERKALLRTMVPPGGPVLYAGHIDGRGLELFREVCRRDLEGVVAKWKRGTYLDGNTLRTSWLKIKNPTYSQIEGRGELFQKRRVLKANA